MSSWRSTQTAGAGSPMWTVLQGSHCVTQDFLRFVAFLQFRDHAQVFQRGGIAFHVSAGGEFAQKAAHDFAAARFWQRVGEADVVGLGQRADFLGDPLSSILLSVAGDGLRPFSSVTNAAMAWPLISSGRPTTAASATASMRDQRGFHFHGAEPVAGDVQHVVDAAHDPEVAVFIFARAVAGEVHAGDLRPVLAAHSARDRRRWCAACRAKVC